MDLVISEFRVSRTEEPFRELNRRASSLKKILSRIPDEIYDRKSFLETIKYEFPKIHISYRPLIIRLCIK